MREWSIPSDFDGWRRLAAEDPEHFEVLRRRRIEEAIAQASPCRQHRLRCLQWRIEQERKRAPTPLAACVSLSHMMWGSVVGRGGLMEALHGSTDHPSSARVLPFNLRR